MRTIEYEESCETSRSSETQESLKRPATFRTGAQGCPGTVGTCQAPEEERGCLGFGEIAVGERLRGRDPDERCEDGRS